MPICSRFTGVPPQFYSICHAIGVSLHGLKSIYLQNKKEKNGGGGGARTAQGPAAAPATPADSGERSGTEKRGGRGPSSGRSSAGGTRPNELT